MAKNKKPINLSYKIAQIHTLKFAFKDIDTESLNLLFNTPNALGIDTTVAINFDKEKSTIAIDINTSLINNESNAILVEHSGRTLYAVNGLSDFYNAEDEKFNLPDNFMIQLFAMAYSHARALLATEISPTAYKDKYILPVIDPKSFFTH